MYLEDVYDGTSKDEVNMKGLGALMDLQFGDDVIFTKHGIAKGMINYLIAPVSKMISYEL